MPNSSCPLEAFKMRRNPRGLSVQVKETLIQKGLAKRMDQLAKGTAVPPSVRHHTMPESHIRFDRQPGYQQVRLMQEGAQRLGVESPFFMYMKARPRRVAPSAHRRP